MSNKSILKKQMTLYMGILLVTFGMLGITLSMVFSDFYIKQKREELVEQGRKISGQYARGFFTGVIDIQQITYELQILEEYMNASVFFLDKKGEVSIVSSRINQSFLGKTITDETIQGVLEGNIVSVQGKFDGMFAETVLTVGYPIMIGDTILGGIFMCTSMPEIERNVAEMYKAGIICMGISVVFGAVLVYFSSLRMSKPLLEMNAAAKVIANGNFEQRIMLDSNDEFGQLAASLNDMAASLNQHEEERRKLIANISHDLRSPLTSIQGFLSALLDGTIEESRRDHYLNIILEETKRLSALTNNIMDLNIAQSSDAQLDKTRFDINELLRETLERMQPRFDEKQISAKLILAEEESYVCADGEKIQRVFQNLVDNALKFTDLAGKIEVETTLLKEKKKLMVSVRDNGRGISEEDQKHIFDRFYKVDASRGEDKKGGGLGLAIAKEFMKAHGETLAVKSVLGEGAEFTFYLSLAGKEE